MSTIVISFLQGAAVQIIRDPDNFDPTEAIDAFADRTDVVFASHHWPTWGEERIVEFLSLQRDLYAYLHDQTLRMLNQGMTGAEIAEVIELPPALGARGPPVVSTSDGQMSKDRPPIAKLPLLSILTTVRVARSSKTRNTGHKPVSLKMV